jgi:hypothetical protein
MASMVDRSVARRIDRLARRAHGFHRFAHHPLCGEYKDELIRLGRRTRICRGCALTAAGGVTGLAVGGWVSPSSLLALGAMLVGALFFAASLRRRAPKSVTRLVPALAFGFALAGGAVTAGLVAVTGALLAGAYRRRGPDRTPCATCPERLGEVPCRGWKEIVTAERAFRRLSGRWLDGASGRVGSARRGAPSA